MSWHGVYSMGKALRNEAASPLSPSTWFGYSSNLTDLTTYMYPGGGILQPELFLHPMVEQALLIDAWSQDAKGPLSLSG